MEKNSSKLYSSIRDVAKLAGVSISTVSRVINHPELTSPSMQEKVNKAIEQCNYSPDIVSINTITKKKKTIAFFVLDIANPFYIFLIKEFLKLSYENNFSLIICEAKDSQAEKKHFDYCRSIRVDGIIYSASYENKSPAIDNKTNIPIALIDHAPFPDIPAYSIMSDNDKMLQLLVTYLYHLNHKRIAFVGCQATTSIYFRYEAYKKYIDQYDIEYNNDLVHLSEFYNEQAGIEAFDKFYALSTPPTAVIAASDQIAHGFIMRAMALGARIPEDFSVCGIDGVSNFYYPQITSIRQNIEEIAETAFKYIDSPDVSVPCSSTIDVSFKMGQTCRNL